MNARDDSGLQVLSAEFERALLSVDRPEAQRVLGAQAGLPLTARLDAIVVPALDRIGDAWESGMVALSQVYMAGRVAEELISAVSPPRPREPRPPRVALTVLEDHHQLGKRMVASTLGAAGHDVADLGRTTVDTLVEQVRRERYEVVLISVLMLASARRVREVVERVASFDPQVKVVVGGAPFRLDPELAARVGAHATGPSASDAVHLVRRFLGEPR